MRFLPLTFALLLAACAAEPDQPGQVTADEERELNEAAAMLDADSIDLNAVADGDREEAE